MYLPVPYGRQRNGNHVERVEKRPTLDSHKAGYTYSHYERENDDYFEDVVFSVNHTEGWLSGFWEFRRQTCRVAISNLLQETGLEHDGGLSLTALYLFAV